jgi:hypothetical protein
MSWFAVKNGQLAYRGRLAREPFDAWLKTRDGKRCLQEAAGGLRVFATVRARRRLWQPLERAARSEPVRTAIQEEAAQFRAAMTFVSYAPGLPRMHVALHRLVIVPRPLVAARARSGVRRRVWTLPALQAVDESVRAFFCEQLLIEMDRALEAARPSPSKSVQAQEGWSCVGTDRLYTWVDPLFSGAHWSGHFFMYEVPRTALTRAQRKELDAAVAGLQRSLGSLSRLQREALVRTAADGLAPASAR